jgi:hypothetical protein
MYAYHCFVLEELNRQVTCSKRSRHNCWPDRRCRASSGNGLNYGKATYISSSILPVLYNEGYLEGNR